MSFADLRKNAAAMGLPPSMTPLTLPEGGPNRTPLPDSMLQPPPQQGGEGGGEGGPAAPKQAKVDVGATVMMVAKMLAVVIDKLGIEIPTGVMVQSPGDVAAFQAFMLSLARGKTPGEAPDPSTPPEAASQPAPAAMATGPAPAGAPAAVQGDPAAAFAQAAMSGAPKLAAYGRGVDTASLPSRDVPLDFETPAARMGQLASQASRIWSLRNGH